jgi:mono/diheme cytochrome c family protein
VRSAVCLLLVALATVSVAAGSVGRAGPGQETTPTGQNTVEKKTVWDGVFTEEQVMRGQNAYRQSCAPCHKDDLLGDNGAPPLAGAQFSARWVGSTVDDMVQTVRSSMPQDAPDTLTQRVYVDIISHLLKANGSPAGAIELPVERAALKQILITSPRR